MKAIIFRLLSKGFTPITISILTGLKLPNIYHYNKKWNDSEVEFNKLMLKVEEQIKGLK